VLVPKKELELLAAATSAEPLTELVSSSAAFLLVTLFFHATALASASTMLRLIVECVCR
jgi:hypothetical protein